MGQSVTYQSVTYQSDISSPLCVVFQLLFLRISFSSLEPIGPSVVGSHTVSTCKQVSRTFATPSTHYQTQSSCDWGVKGVGNQIVWYFRDHSQTNHKLTGTPYFYVKYVRRDLTICVLMTRQKCVKVGSISHVSIKHSESSACCFYTFFLRISFSSLEPIGRFQKGVVYRQYVHTSV